jgi:hypothetical protein
MYNVPRFLLVSNPIDRYSIGNRTPGLDIADDGSLTISMQTEPSDNQANWLPTLSGDFRPIMRLQQARPEVLSGHYRLPAIRSIS